MLVKPHAHIDLAFSPRWIFSNKARLGIVCTKENGQRGRMTVTPES